MPSQTKPTVLHIGDPRSDRPGAVRAVRLRIRGAPAAARRAPTGTHPAATLRDRKWGNSSAGFRPFCNSARRGDGRPLGRGAGGAGFDWADVDVMAERGIYNCNGARASSEAWRGRSTACARARATLQTTSSGSRGWAASGTGSRRRRAPGATYVDTLDALLGGADRAAPFVVGGARWSRPCRAGSSGGAEETTHGLERLAMEDIEAVLLKGKPSTAVNAHLMEKKKKKKATSSYLWLGMKFELHMYTYS
ncbi:hypothetical protein F4780DRAFT_783553 [Xylariomycetidae sp. FL0641]|nr:hypothetical protein F4780DRAFT_783553 [Xylariomycetidae sp. FL0641]